MSILKKPALKLVSFKNNIYFYLTDEKPAKHFLVIALGVKSGEGSISKVRLVNPLNKTTFIPALTLDDMNAYPKIKDEMLATNSLRNFEYLKRDLRSAYYIFDATDFAYKKTKLRLLYDIDGKVKRIKINYDPVKSQKNSALR